MSQPPRILVVDDEEHIRRILTVMLAKPGYQTETAADGVAALERLEKAPFDLVITDLRMPRLDGLDLLRRIKEHDPDLTVIIMTAFSSIETAVEAMRQGAYDYVSKPFREDVLLLTLEKALERRNILAENRALKAEIQGRYDFSNFIGRSAPMQRVFEVIAKVAETKSTVLILGESGTGKELAARSIHFNSPRRERPFVAINCGAVPANLLESEFFGYARGAFSGAQKEKKGLFEEADAGTLFLDEVSDLPLDLQVKILRALQEEEIRRLGEAAPRKIDLRVIAASNRDLEAEVQAGRFREDLFYRLNVIRLTLPPLRDRPEDVPLLTRRFLEEVTERNDLEMKKISPEALRALSRHAWPGNVRELKNVIEQAAIMAEGPLITPADLPFDHATVSLSGGLSVVIPDDGGLNLKDTLKQVGAITERTLIARALAETQGNRTHAAARLGISRRSLISKIQILGIESGEEG